MCVDVANLPSITLVADGKITKNVNVLIEYSANANQIPGAELEISKLAEFLIQHGFEGAELIKFSETGVPDCKVL